MLYTQINVDCTFYLLNTALEAGVAEFEASYMLCNGALGINLNKFTQTDAEEYIKCYSICLQRILICMFNSFVPEFFFHGFTLYKSDNMTMNQAFIINK